MKFVGTLILVFSYIFSFAQNDEDQNIVISKSVRSFAFVKGNSEYPVQIKEKSERTYYCKNYRSTTPVVEFYNDIEKIDEVAIEVSGSKKHGIFPKYEYYNSEGIFYSDAHVCYFTLPLEKKGANSIVVFKKTILDPKYFTRILFADDKEIEEQTVSIDIPNWMEAEIIEYNLQDYQVEKAKNQNSDITTYTYKIKNTAPIKKEWSAPGITYYVPHLLILSKSARPQGESYTYFKTLDDQYRWYRSLVKQIGNDEAIIKEKTNELLGGMVNEEEKVKTVFRWVQDNIRYIAFENGIAGFKPEKAQEVLKKKYGDCKGMANLLTEMLRSQNIDVRRCWIGTRHIRYDYSTPSLSVDNHMISVWMNKGNPVFLDPTEKYIGFGEVSERIQGRQTLIEDGDKYLLQHIPVATNLQNTAKEVRKLSLEGDNLKGQVMQTWKGENKVWMLNQLFDIKQDKQEDALKQYLSEGKSNYEINNLTITNLTNYNADLQVSYEVLWKDVASVFGKETYLDINNRRTLENLIIDTSKRELPYWFSFKEHQVFETELTYNVNQPPSIIPEKFMVERPEYIFNGVVTNNLGKLFYRCEIIISKPVINPAQFQQWNADIRQLQEFYNQQIVFTTK